MSYNKEHLAPSTPNSNRIYLEGKEFRLIVTTEWYGKSKQLLLTAFDLRPISRKNPKRAKEMKKAPKR